MDSQKLRFYPRLHHVFTEVYRSFLIDLFTRIDSRSKDSLLNTYSCFVDVAVKRSDSAFNPIDIYNNEVNINKHFELLVGFLYTEMNGSCNYTYGMCRRYKLAFKDLAEHHNLTFNNIDISTLRITEQAEHCIALYKKKQKNTELLNYYTGWVCYSKEGKELNLHLATFCDFYGALYTKEIHQAILNYAKKRKKTSLSKPVIMLVELLNNFTQHCPTLAELKHSMREENSTALMLKIFIAKVADCVSQDNDVQYLFKVWSAAIIPNFIACFITPGIFDEPQRPFICPKYKQLKASQTALSLGGKLSEKEESRLFSLIPLEIKDEQAIELISARVNRDIEHVQLVCTQLVSEINERHDRNLTLRERGQIKPYPYLARGSKSHFPIGPSSIENTVATFYHHAKDYEVNIATYHNFLGYRGESSILIEELNIPTLISLMPFLLLLVIEHPKITPSWLHEWELFDKNGNMIGFKQVGKQWVAVSYKNRRGINLAQQEVILTKHSKFIVESLIKHTEFAREGLKMMGNNDWRYAILVSTLNKPKRFASLGNALITCNRDGFIQRLVADTYIEKGGKKELVLGKKSAKRIAPLVTLRNTRKTRGLQVYMETRSIKAVSEALGHKEPNLEMLTSYLPQSLMDFFNTRWIRIFQNAIIFEALKESPYLIDALDFSERKLEEFLINHRLGELPDNLKKVNDCLVNEDNQHHITQLDELVFTLTTPLLQVLIAISVMVESALEDEIFTPIIQKWYESAVFILNHFTLSGKSITYVQGVKDSQSLYDTALENPLDINKFKDSFLCR